MVRHGRYGLLRRRWKLVLDWTIKRYHYSQVTLDFESKELTRLQKHEKNKRNERREHTEQKQQCT